LSALAEILPELGRSARSRSFIDWFDIVLRDPCHEIIGIIAVQHKQFNFVWKGRKPTVVVLLLLAAPSVAGTIVQPSRPDPLLDSGPTAPCAAGVDYAPAIDANGNSVIPADVVGGRVPLPDAVAIPMNGNRGNNHRRHHSANSQSGDSSYISLDGKKLEPLLNPPPCSASTR
jgi:hypothetical protein